MRGHMVYFTALMKLKSVLYGGNVTYYTALLLYPYDFKTSLSKQKLIFDTAFWWGSFPRFSLGH